MPAFDGHIDRFLAGASRYRTWNVEKVAVAPLISQKTRTILRDRGHIAQDLDDLTRGL